MESTFSLTDVKGSDQPGIAVAGDGAVYAFTKERPPLATTAGPTQGQLPTPPRFGN